MKKFLFNDENIPQNIIKLVCNSISTMLCAMLLIGLTACNETSVPPPEPLKLEGTAWKLLYFLDVETNTKREPEYHKVLADPLDPTSDSVEVKPQKNHFTLAFNNDTVLTGRSIANTLGGSYSVNYNTNILCAIIGGTKVYEAIKYARLYCDILYEFEEFSFELSTDTLKLFYNDKKIV